MAKALRFKQPNVARQLGELGRIKVLKGPDAGSVFILSAAQTTIGRGEDNDIVISDLKASRKHAEVVIDGNQWSIRDIGSANGIVHNGTVTRSAKLSVKDVVTVGETTFEFMISGALQTRSLVAPALSGPLNNVIAFPVSATGTQSIHQSPPSAGLSPKAKQILAAAVAVIVAVAFFGESAPKKKKSTGGPSLVTTVRESDFAAVTKAANIDGYTTYSGNKINPSLRTADNFFREGFREYSVGNYVRARVQLETALQINPNHELAKMYVENCRIALKERIDIYLENGEKNLERGRLRTAKGQFELVLRALQNDPSAHYEPFSEICKASDECRIYYQAKAGLEKTMAEMIGQSQSMVGGGS